MVSNLRTDGFQYFEVTSIEVANPSHIVLFGAGPGGNPLHYHSLLWSLADHGFLVVAPHFKPLESTQLALPELSLRARRMRLALDDVVRPNVPVVGVGHSIGGAILLALAGGQLTNSEARVPIERDARIDGLALMAPQVERFRAPGALHAVRAPLLLWVGAEDAYTPPSHYAWLAAALPPGVPYEVRVIEEAGHFSFVDWDTPDPTELLSERGELMARLAEESRKFVLGTNDELDEPSPP